MSEELHEGDINQNIELEKKEFIREALKVVLGI